MKPFSCNRSWNPIKAIPSSIDIMESQIEQGQNGSIDFVSAEGHSLSRYIQ